MFYVLGLAGIYNLLWGSWVVAFPDLSMSVFGAQPVQPREIWQCVGMIVGVYGLGYIAASIDPMRHWPIVLVGFLGKIFGPIGFVKAMADGVFPPWFALNILFNDIIWWVPFFLILKASYTHFLAQQSKTKPSESAVHKELKKLIHTLPPSPIQVPQRKLVVALRHIGCTFTRELMAELAAQKDLLQKSGLELVFLHMSTSKRFDEFAKRYLGNINYRHVSDPEGRVYRLLGLKQGNLSQVFGLSELGRGIKGILKGYGIGALEGDGFQLPGVFIVDETKVYSTFRAQRASDDLPIRHYLETIYN